MNYAPKIGGDYNNSNTYGPFPSFKAAFEYMTENLTHPGAWSKDPSGKERVPVKAPNGHKVKKPPTKSKTAFEDAWGRVAFHKEPWGYEEREGLHDDIRDLVQRQLGRGGHVGRGTFDLDRASGTIGPWVLSFQEDSTPGREIHGEVHVYPEKVNPGLLHIAVGVPGHFIPVGDVMQPEGFPRLQSKLQQAIVKTFEEGERRLPPRTLTGGYHIATPPLRLVLDMQIRTLQAAPSVDGRPTVKVEGIFRVKIADAKIPQVLVLTFNLMDLGQDMWAVENVEVKNGTGWATIHMVEALLAPLLGQIGATAKSEGLIP